MRHSILTQATAGIFTVLIFIASFACTTDGDLDEKFVMSAKSGDSEKLSSLIKKGININARDRKHGATALMWAAHEGHINAVRILLDNGADIDTQQELGRTALWYTAQQGETAAARILIAAGADIDLPSHDGKTPHDIALELGNHETADLLAKASASSN